ncbi:uncharacterized protein LOC143182535 [Calliopsis andreniformis]|uniref:uncharacterized protein LOC143182535 n=1 Tax=Calliopsis andreniformis TaxID=337506 RepID=UPI003FCE2E5D
MIEVLSDVYTYTTRIIDSDNNLISVIIFCSLIGLIFATELLFYTSPERCVQLLNVTFLVENLNQRTYCHSITLYIATTSVINIFAIISTEMTTLSFSEHICGLFRIVGIHLKKATNVSKIPAPEKAHQIFLKVRRAVRIHVKAIMFMNAMWESFASGYSIIIFFGIGAVSVNMICLCNAIKSMDDWIQLFSSLAILIAMVLYGVCETFFGQRVIDHSFGIFYDAYDSHWYEVPTEIQKLYLFVLQRSIVTCSYSKNGLFVSSLEGLTTMASTSFSYFTLFHSIQE